MAECQWVENLAVDISLYQKIVVHGSGVTTEAFKIDQL